MTIQKGLIYAIIPARSGSTSVKNKNIRPLAGHPMIAYSIGVAKLVPDISRVIVSTDSEEYGNIAKKYGAEVPFLRPKEISGNYSTDTEFMIHAIEWLENNDNVLPEYWVHLRPTTPIRNPDIVSKAIETIKLDNTATSLRSAHLTDACPYKWFKKNSHGYFESFDGISLDDANNPRQTFPKTYVPDGYVDILKTKFIIENRKIHGTKIIGFEVPFTIDVDYEDDMNNLKKIVTEYSGPVMKWLSQKAIQ